MNLSKGFNLANKYYQIILVPIILDLLKLGEIIQRAQEITLKLTIPSAIPSVTQVLGNPNQDSGGFNVNLPYDSLGSISWLIMILFIMAGAFLKGGFLGCVLAGIKEQEVSAGTYIQMAKKYFGRFILQSIIIFVLLIGLLPFFFALGPLALLYFIGIFVLFFFLIFWDYIIVVEDAQLIDAARSSLDLVRSNLGKVLSFIIPIAIITALIGILANFLIAASPVMAVIAIAGYAYFGTVVIFAIMMFYLESIRNVEN